MTNLKGFKFEIVLVSVLKMIESEDKYDEFYSSSNAEIIINDSDIDDMF